MKKYASSLLDKIKIETRKKLNTEFIGNYKSAFKGNGILFDSVREYEYGDDIKAIDWNVSARMDKLYIKEYVEERELNIVLMIDMSNSMNFGGERNKKEVLLEAVTLFLYLAQHNNDSITVVIFTDKAEVFFKPKKGRKFVLKTLNDIISYLPASRKTDIGKAVEFVQRTVKKRSIIFVLSDFLDEDYLLKLKRLRRKHDVIPVRIADDLENNFSFFGLTQFFDMESNEVVYAESIPVLDVNKLQGFDMINLSTSETIENAVMKYFAKRKKMRVR